jgi:hypothetical protein
MVDQDLSRLYPEHGNYFQTKGCQGILRRILLLWCLRHPECGYRQGKLLSQETVTHNMFTIFLLWHNIYFSFQLFKLPCLIDSFW